MPPEHALGQDFGTAGDVFSLGTVLAFAATGRNAFGELAPAAMLKSPGTDAKQKSREPTPEVFTTPPNGVAPQPLWHGKAASLSRNYDVTPQAFADLFLVVGETTAAYDIKTGKQKWSREGIANPAATLTVSGSTLFLAGPEYDGTVIGYDIRTGKESWRTNLGGKMQSGVQVAAVDDKRIYVIAELSDADPQKDVNAIVAIDIRSRTVLWQEQRDEGTQEQVELTVGDGFLVYIQKPSVLQGVLYVMDFDSGVWAVEPKSGKKIWMSEDLGRRPFGDRIVRTGDSLYIGSFFEQGGVYAFDAETGKLRWNYNDGVEADSEWQIAQAGNRLLVAHAGELYALPAV